MGWGLLQLLAALVPPCTRHLSPWKKTSTPRPAPAPPLGHESDRFGWKMRSNSWCPPSAPAKKKVNEFILFQTAWLSTAVCSASFNLLDSKISAAFAAATESSKENSKARPVRMHTSKSFESFKQDWGQNAWRQNRQCDSKKLWGIRSPKKKLQGS